MCNRLFSRSSIAALGLVFLAALAAGSATAAVTYQVTIDTSSVSGTAGNLDFQFNPGNASSQAATVTLSNFNGGGGVVTGPPQVSGNVTGTLPGNLVFANNPSALNEYFQPFTYGSQISFTVTLMGPAIDSPDGLATAGSTFGVGLYDNSFLIPQPILTNQGAGSGFAGQIDINLNGSTTATAFPNANNGPSVVTFTLGSPYFVRYASNLNLGDSVIDITNTGASSTTALPIQNGNLCVNVYAFSPDEQLVSCCSCLLTPDGLVSLSVKNDLISNTLTPGMPTSIVVKLLASNGGTAFSSCNAGTVGTGTNLLASGLAAWGTTLHALPGNAAYGVSETPFVAATLSGAELARITTLCSLIQSNGSGYGICKVCRLGGQGASKQ